MTSSSQCSPTRFYSGHRDPTGCTRATGWLTNSRRLAEVPSACCPAHRMPTVLLDAPVLLGAPLLSRRFIHVQRTGCSWMLVTSHGHMSGSYMCSAQDARGCSWMLVGARDLPWAHERFLPVKRTGCSWMLVDDRALPWTHERFLPVLHTGCWRMLGP